MVPFEKDKSFETYEFNFVPLWILIFNVLFECMDRTVAIEIGKVVGEVLALIGVI